MVVAPVPLGARWPHALALFLEHLVGRSRLDDLWPRWRDRRQERLARALSESGPGRIVRIEERHDLGVDEFVRDYLQRGRPVVLKGAAREWPCCKRWDLDYLIERWGDYPSSLPTNDGLIDRDEPQDFEQLTLADYLTHVKAGGKKYLKFSQLLMDRPEVRADLDVEWFRARRGSMAMLEEFQLFIGGAGTYTPIHCALPANLFLQVWGTKRWLLFHPLAYPVLDPPAARLIYFHSGLDPRAPDESRFPASPYLSGYEVILEAGDVLFNPTYMWHCVANLTASIGIGYRWSSPFRSLETSFILTLLNLLATNPSLPEAIYYSRIKKTKTIHVPKSSR